MKQEMADCLTYWTASYSSDDFYGPSLNLCSDDSSFTDDEGKEVTSLLDDLAEAKRSLISTDDIDNDPDTDCVSLLDDVFEEQWTTKDSSGGPTLAELNGGELTDMEQYEPLKFARKWKVSQSSLATSSQQNAGRLMAPVKMCDVNNTDSTLETVKQPGDATIRCTNTNVVLPYDQQRTISLEEQQDVKGTLTLSEPDHKVGQSGGLLVHDKWLKTVSSLQQLKEVSPDVRRTCNGCSKRLLTSSSEHSWELDASGSCYDVCVHKRKKTSCSATVHHVSVGDESETETSDVENCGDNVQTSVDTPPSSSWCRNMSDSISVLEAPRQYFWLYNVQSKGPKCQPPTARLLTTSSDPHILSHFHDPVTDSRSRMSVKESGRRERDRSATDVDANPRRLLQIGNELHHLTAIINASPSTAADFSLSPREKNKYASRICRLKRKAQHEANKIKLQGLEQEHCQLMTVLNKIKMHLVQRVKGQRSEERSAGEHSTLSSTLQSLIKEHLSEMIAEHTDEYVSCTLERLQQKAGR